MKASGLFGIILIIVALGCCIEAIGSSKPLPSEEVNQQLLNSSFENGGSFEQEKSNPNRTQRSLRKASQDDLNYQLERLSDLDKTRSKRELKVKILWGAAALIGIIGLILTLAGFTTSEKPKS